MGIVTHTTPLDELIRLSDRHHTSPNIEVQAWAKHFRYWMGRLRDEDLLQNAKTLRDLWFASAHLSEANRACVRALCVAAVQLGNALQATLSLVDKESGLVNGSLSVNG